jgi:lipopolysaccharide cholinephosphotransferase
MIPISKEQVRLVQLDIASYLDKVARENNIKYSMGGGTLLGSIRHQGFIPWDDDVDIMLTRANYEKLMEVLMSSIESPYELIYYKHSESFLPFAKVYDTRTTFHSKLDNLHRGTGIFVDIFPIDVLPGSEEETRRFKEKVKRESFNLATTNSNGIDYASASKWRYFFGKLVLWFPKHLKNRGKNYQIAEALDNLMQTYTGSGSGKVGFVASYYRQEEFPEEIFQEYEDSQFEDRKLMKIKNHDRYLSQLFNQYMELPSEKDRLNHSYYSWYWKDK